MNDRYLFKAKRIDNGEWVDGFYLTIGDKAYIICEAEASCMYGDNTDLYATEWYEVQPETICQCTGLTDKDGERIWENDVVSYEDTESDLECYHDNVFVNRVKVFIEPYGGVFFYNRQTVDMDDLWISNSSIEAEVMGNIFDNPELLKEGEKDE